MPHPYYFDPVENIIRREEEQRSELARGAIAGVVYPINSNGTIPRSDAVIIGSWNGRNILQVPGEIHSIFWQDDCQNLTAAELGEVALNLQPAVSVDYATRPVGGFQRYDLVRVIDNRRGQPSIPIGTLFIYDASMGGLVWGSEQLELVARQVQMSELGRSRVSPKIIMINRETKRFFWQQDLQNLSDAELRQERLPRRYYPGFVNTNAMGSGRIVRYSLIHHDRIICGNPDFERYFWGWNGENLTGEELAAEGLSSYHATDAEETIAQYRIMRIQIYGDVARAPNDFGGGNFTIPEIPYPTSDISSDSIIAPVAVPRRSTSREMWDGAGSGGNGAIRVANPLEEAIMGDQQDESPIYEGKWPIGTIVKLDLSKSGVADFISSTNHSIEYPLVKIVKYNASRSIQDMIWIGEIEPFNTQIEDLYFIEASAEECAEYQLQLEKLRQCTTRPSIGTVLKYIGNNLRNKGKNAVVVAEANKNRIIIQWLTGDEAGGKRTYDFNMWQIARRQVESFIPDLSTYCTCSHCHSLRPLVTYGLNDLKKIGEQIFCDMDCAVEAGYNYCRDCRTWSRLSEFEDCRGVLICQSCYTQHYRQCNDCDHFYNVGRMRANIFGELQCDNCSRYGLEIIREYSFKPAPRPTKMAWENTRYLGIELEVESEKLDSKELASRVKSYLKQETKPGGKQLEKLVYFKHDGSLQNGVEIVFHPFTLQAFHKHFPMKSFLKFVEDNHGIISNRCGMHVHVSKKRLSSRQLLNGKWFFHKCQPFLEQFSGRDGDFHYCTFEGAPGTDPYKQRNGRRTALNVAGSPETLEIRLFRSTLNYHKFMSNIQFADVFVDYIQHGANQVFLKTNSGKLIWEHFLDYAKRNEQYQTMTSWILKKGIV